MLKIGFALLIFGLVTSTAVKDKDHHHPAASCLDDELAYMDDLARRVDNLKARMAHAFQPSRPKRAAKIVRTSEALKMTAHRTTQDVEDIATGDFSFEFLSPLERRYGIVAEAAREALEQQSEELANGLQTFRARVEASQIGPSLAKLGTIASEATEDFEKMGMVLEDSLAKLGHVGTVLMAAVVAMAVLVGLRCLKCLCKPCFVRVE